MSKRLNERTPRGLILILAATGVAGVSGYAIQLLAPALLHEASDYLTFSAFWSVLFLLGSAVGGIQQEVARATRPASLSLPARRGIRKFTVASAVVVVAGTIIVGFIVGAAAFGEQFAWVMGALVIGLLGYLLTAVVTGLFYGLGALGMVASLIAVDAGLRGGAVVIGLLAGASIDVLAYLVALPFGIAVTLIWLLARRQVVGRYSLDVGDARLARNALSTVIAAASIGVMVTGMPLLFRVLLPDASPTVLASLTLVVTLTRAPFIIPLMALQSYLVVGFRNAPDVTARRLRAYLLCAVAVGVIAAVAAAALGPWIVDFITGSRYSTDGFTSAAVVASASLVGCLCITGPALIAENRHVAYTSGWVVSALATVACLLLFPTVAETRAVTALLGGPLLGLFVHLGCLRWGAIAGPSETTEPVD